MLKAGRSSLLVTLLSVACAAGASTDSVWFARNWQSDKGLPNNTIFDLTQTFDGYLWLGTSVGLVSFDGSRFKNTPLPIPFTRETGECLPYRRAVAVDCGQEWSVEQSST